MFIICPAQLTFPNADNAILVESRISYESRNEYYECSALLFYPKVLIRQQIMCVEQIF